MVTKLLVALLFGVPGLGSATEEAGPTMLFADTDHGGPFAKDPDVVRFRGQYWMYYSLRREDGGFAVGIATSSDLDDWTKAGEMLPGPGYEAKGLAAPAAIVLGGRVHLFYQTYGNARLDAICHAVSDDGLHFQRNPGNPIFRPSGEWNCGRAIDAEAVVFGDRLLLYCATRDPGYAVQMVTGASAPLDSDYGPSRWTPLGEGPLLRPELGWERRCIEAPAVVVRDGRLFMFYAGGYNNEPQQIGCAVSADGVAWRRLSSEPLLPNGPAGSWNESESGHPGVFVDDDGATHLFFQGNRDGGKTWYLSRMRVGWRPEGPSLVRPADGQVFLLR